MLFDPTCGSLLVYRYGHVCLHMWKERMCMLHFLFVFVMSILLAVCSEVTPGNPQGILCCDVGTEPRLTECKAGAIPPVSSMHATFIILPIPLLNVTNIIS